MVNLKPVKQPGSGNAALIEKSVVLLLFLLLVAGVFFILRPFIVGLLFGCILAVAGWPVRTQLVRQGLSGTSAAILMLVTLLLFVLMPAVLAAPDVADGVKVLGERGVAWLLSSPELPAWITGLPFVGDMLTKQWQFIMSGTPEAHKMIVSYASPLRQFLTAAAVGFAGSMLQLAVSLIVATTFWSRGGIIVAELRDSLARLGGEGLASLTDVAGGAIKGVFYGVVGTAAVQGVLMAFGLLLAGVPAAVPLGFITLLLAISQFGSVLINFVWAGAAWWLYTTSGSGLAFWFVIVWGIFVTLLDNVLKPWLIGSSIDMPIALVILGVFGGFISFGFLGLFIGPTLLAIAYALVVAWRGRQVQSGNNLSHQRRSALSE